MFETAMREPPRKEIFMYTALVFRGHFIRLRMVMERVIV